MPHDKIVYNNEKNIYDKYVKVDLDSMEEKQEDIEKDGIIKKCLELYQKSQVKRQK